MKGNKVLQQWVYKSVPRLNTRLFLLAGILVTVLGGTRAGLAFPVQQHQHPPQQNQTQPHQHPPQQNQQQHQHPPQKPSTTPESQSQPADHSGHAPGSEAHSMMKTLSGGPFQAMAAIGSGTSLMPASSPAHMWHKTAGDWLIMAHWDLKLGFNHQGGPRGVNKAESQNWLMLMAERQFQGGGTLMLRGMFSAEPWTTPNRGFPELFQTGESFEGRPIIDAQHPHDLFMELAVSYTVPLSERVSVHLYGGPVGEPALGPVAFMHRASAAENPAAPLGHHWQDSTHIVHGVFSAGVTAGRFRVEGSIFRGAEPDEDRTDIEMGKLDSWSYRVWFTPTREWSLQYSHGRLTNPESLEPGDLTRDTASVSYNRQWHSGNWASSLIWGRNSESHGDSNAYLLESTLTLAEQNHLYGRIELADKIGLLQENIFGRAGTVDDHGHSVSSETDEHESDAERWFRVAAFTFGGVRDFIATSKLRMGIGADATFYKVPSGLKPVYGSSPTSFHLFLRLRPGKMSH